VIAPASAQGLEACPPVVGGERYREEVAELAIKSMVRLWGCSTVPTRTSGKARRRSARRRKAMLLPVPGCYGMTDLDRLERMVLRRIARDFFPRDDDDDR
jgi:hypothetical protein